MKLNLIRNADMSMIRLGLLAAVCMTVCGVCSASEALETDGGIWGDPEISAAIEKAQKGDAGDLERLEDMTSPNSGWTPVKKNLPKYHACLGAKENMLVQFFAITAINLLKDISSVEPLQKFITSANLRLKKGKLPQRENFMLMSALARAIVTLGEIDGDDERIATFLGTLLKDDLSMEFGGAFAHSALAKKRAPGLRRLLEAALTADEKQIGYVSSAINEIRDPALIDALYSACLDPKYSGKARGLALYALAGMRTVAPRAEQLVIDILKDEKSDLRADAAYCVSGFGTEKGFKLLQEVRNAPGKGGPELVQVIDDLILRSKVDNTPAGIVKAILSSTTPDEEKIALCFKVRYMNKDEVAKHAETLVPCLNVNNAAGEPLNEARISIWLALYWATKIKHPLTLLPYEDEQQFKNETFNIRKEFLAEYHSAGKYLYEEREKMAEEATKQLVTIWVKGKTENTGGVK